MGNTDISDLGSSITGAISTLKGARLIHRVTADGTITFSQALAVINSYYNQLTIEEKWCSIMRLGSTLLTNLNDNGVFSYVMIASTTAIDFYRVHIPGKVYDNTRISQGSGGVAYFTYQDYSNSSLSANIALYVI